MLKGDTYSNQLFNVHAFALFIDTFLDKKCGIIDGYKNNMNITASGTNITINSGACVVRGRFMEEDSTTTLSTSSIANKYCALVIEIDLSKTNTDSSLLQATYKILQSAGSTPSLTQQDIINNYSSGVYQYLLATFQTNGSGTISNLVKTDERLSIESVYEAFGEEIQDKLDDLQEAINNVTADTILSSIATLQSQVSNLTPYVYHSENNSPVRSLTIATQYSLYNYMEIIYGKSGTRKSTGKIYIGEYASSSMSILLDQAQLIGSTFQIYSSICSYVKNQNGSRTLTLGNEGYVNYNTSTNAWGSRTTETDMKIYDVILYK